MQRRRLMLGTIGFACLGFAFAPTGSPQSSDPPKQSAPGTVPEGWEAQGDAIGAGGWAKKARDPRTGIVFLLVAPGETWIGSLEVTGTEDEHPRHRVHLTQPFYLGETEVTVAQWRQFADATKYQTDAEHGVPLEGRRQEPQEPRLEGGLTLQASGTGTTLDARANWKSPLPARMHPVDEREPVTLVSWNDAMKFCSQAGYRLPTEIEWEYVARADPSPQDWSFWWGADEKMGAGRGNFADQTPLDDGSTWASRFPFTDDHWCMAPVGSFAANPWGFQDILGNVWEWCADADTAEGSSRSAEGSDDAPKGAEKADVSRARVVRGGSWLTHPALARSASRVGCWQALRNAWTGFRVAMTP